MMIFVFTLNGLFMKKYTVSKKAIHKQKYTTLTLHKLASLMFGVH